MEINIKSNISEINPETQRDETHFLNPISTDSNFVINNVTQKTIRVPYTEKDTFSIENIFMAYGLDKANVSFFHISAYTDPAELTLTEKKTAVKMGIFNQDAELIGNMGQFSMCYLSDNEIDYTITQIFPLQDKTTIIKIIIGTI